MGLIEEFSEIDFPFPSTEKEYEMKGSEEEQGVVNGLKSFQPGMVDRKMRPHIPKAIESKLMDGLRWRSTFTSSTLERVIQD